MGQVAEELQLSSGVEYIFQGLGIIFLVTAYFRFLVLLSFTSHPPTHTPSNSCPNSSVVYECSPLFFLDVLSNLILLTYSFFLCAVSSYYAVVYGMGWELGGKSFTSGAGC